MTAAILAEVNAHLSERGQRKAVPKNSAKTMYELADWRKAQVRAFVDLLFQVINNRSGYRGVSYPRIAKDALRASVRAAPANPYLARATLNKRPISLRPAATLRGRCRCVL